MASSSTRIPIAKSLPALPSAAASSPDVARVLRTEGLETSSTPNRKEMLAKKRQPDLEWHLNAQIKVRA